MPMQRAPEATINRREPALVMRLARLGCLHQCRLSFMRILTRRLARENWRFTRPVFDIDDSGVGHAVYSAIGPARTYSLVAFAHDLPPEQRSDRVIAEAWDATFTLFDGVPSKDDITRLARNVPLQEAGRVSESELSLSRANRSVRLWAHVVKALAAGRQPDMQQIGEVGYLMRTTAVYGSGKFGAADRETLAGRPEMQAPFQAEMLSVYLTRAFVRDLVQHMARAHGGDKTATLDPAIARQLGIGNSTGLGMAPFLVNHPVLFSNWIIARERAIARVRNVQCASAGEAALFRDLLRRSELSVSNWRSAHPIQRGKLASLRKDLVALNGYVAGDDLIADHPWDRLWHWASCTLGEEGQEFVASLMLEPYGDLVDGLARDMADNNHDAFRIDGAMAVRQVMSLIEQSFGKTLDIDWTARQNTARVWYISQEKLEPRLGERFDEPLTEFEQPLAPARDAAALRAALAKWPPDTPVAEFLLHNPEHRHALRRAQIAAIAPYGEIRDNTVSATVLPIDMLRCKLAIFGATHFDPRSDRWVRICMYAGAPYPAELCPDNADWWIYPDLGAAR